ncbi:MAG: hypothetical protein GY866_37970 [Proteobacteria bacterium]|nr:hypothetical protein [Pseudomonadota bacterium]
MRSKPDKIKRNNLSNLVVS